MRSLIEATIKLGGPAATPDSPALRFLAAVDDATSPHPFDRHARLHGMVSLTLKLSIDDRNNRVRISDIQSLEPGAGHAADTLRGLCDQADEDRVALELTAKAYGPEHLSTEQLVDWYGRYGFVPEYPSDDPDYDDGIDMIRQPA